jgi:glycosyltransferase involved in cell wall biosynthesis
MRIGLDARMAQYSGIGTTIRHLIEGWTPEQQQQVLLWTHGDWRNPYGMREEPVRDGVYSLNQHWRYARRLNRAALDLFHMPHYDAPLGYRGRLVVTVHDLIQYLFPEYSTKPLSKIYSYVMLRHIARRANRIICVSNATKKDFLALFPRAENRVLVVSPAVDSPTTPLDAAARERVLSLHGLKPGYILYVGNLRKSKNTDGLIAAYAKLKIRKPDAPNLVMAGHNSLSKMATPLPTGVRLLGPVPQEHLSVLYGDALFFAFPSFYEGFGLPPLEAMAHGTPVVVSNRASLPEVCGAAALYVDPASTDDIADQMHRLTVDVAQRERLRRLGFENIKRFSWKTFAERTWRIYEDVMNEAPR